MKKSILILTTLIICATVSAQNGLDLKFKPEKNKAYHFRTTSSQVITQTINGNSQVVESESLYAISLKVVDVTQSFNVAEVRFDTISSKTNMMGKTTTLSSASEGNMASKETSDIISAVMNRLSKSPVYAKIDFTGKVIELVNLKMVASMVLKDTATIVLTGPTKAAVKGQAANLVGESSVKNIIESITYNMPGKTVNTGESWSVTIPTNSGGMSLEITNSYHLDGITGNSVALTGESKIKAAPNALPMEQGGAKITYDDLNGLGKSTISVDGSTGIIVLSTSKMRIMGNMGVSMPGMSMQIPMDINSNTRTVLK
ncbi:MAG: DUF6263 family protein [Bacteroidales bacterium]